MNEESFYERIEQETGWTVNDSNRKFGFIVGICHPFGEFKNMYSANYSPYFTIWKKEDGVVKEEHIDCDSPENMIKDIIEFLKTG